MSGLLELVELFGEFVDSILLLLTQSADLSFTLDVRLFEVSSQLLKLRLSFLVDVDLRLRGSAGFVQSLRQFVQFALKLRPLLFDLSDNKDVKNNLFKYVISQA